MPKKLLIIANWKMNPSSAAEAARMAREIDLGVSKAYGAQVVIAPPFPFLSDVKRQLKKVKLGAQNMHWTDSGPYTGEISWLQLKRLGTQYVIIGHSERRIHMAENDAMVNKKIKAALRSGLIPVIAVGERNKTGILGMRSILTAQLKNGLAGISRKKFKNGIIAYEPVWAIGTGRSATPEHAKTALRIIREALKMLWKNETFSVPVIYGGSVSAKNARLFVTEKGGGMNGMLVGGASLLPKEFIKIVESSQK